MSPDQEQFILYLYTDLQIKQRAFQDAQDKLDLALLRAGNPTLKLRLVEPEKPLTPQPQTEERHSDKEASANT